MKVCHWLWPAVLFFTPYPADSADAMSRKPNIVFIMADDLGWRDVCCCGNSFIDTPSLDKLAKDGVRFSHAYQQTVCSPTRAALLTGMHPVRTGITDYLSPRKGEKFLDPKLVTINERLKEAGYVSGLIGKWHLTGSYEEGKGSPDKHGWDEVICSETSYIAGGDYFHPYAHISNLPVRLGEGEYLTDRLNLEACDFIRRNRSKPFFLYLSHYAVHTALAAKPALVEKYKKRLAEMPREGSVNAGTNAVLAAMMESIDDGVGLIRRTLGEMAIDGNTIIIFTSDNGGEAVRRGKDGKLKPSGVTSAAPLRAGKSHLYEGGIRVPLIVFWPGNTPAGAVCNVPVNGLDWFPTLLAVAGLKPDGSQPMDGADITGLLRNPGEKRTAAMFWHYPLQKPHFLGGRSSAAMRDGRWKLIEFFDTGKFELYDMDNDEAEQHDLAEENQAKLKEMHNRLDSWRKTLGVAMPECKH